VCILSSQFLPPKLIIIITIIISQKLIYIFEKATLCTEKKLVFWNKKIPEIVFLGGGCKITKIHHQHNNTVFLLFPFWPISLGKAVCLSLVLQFQANVHFCANPDVLTCDTHGRVHVNVVNKHKRHLERGSVYVAAEHRLNLVLLLFGMFETTPKLEQSANHLTNPNNFCQSCHFRKRERESAWFHHIPRLILIFNSSQPLFVLVAN